MLSRYFFFAVFLRKSQWGLMDDLHLLQFFTMLVLRIHISITTILWRVAYTLSIEVPTANVFNKIRALNRDKPLKNQVKPYNFLHVGQPAITNHEDEPYGRKKARGETGFRKAWLRPILKRMMDCGKITRKGNYFLRSTSTDQSKSEECVIDGSSTQNPLEG